MHADIKKGIFPRSALDISVFNSKCGAMNLRHVSAPQRTMAACAGLKRKERFGSLHHACRRCVTKEIECDRRMKQTDKHQRLTLTSCSSITSPSEIAGAMAWGMFFLRQK